MQFNPFRDSNPAVEHNILILGNTGVGKSTFINGFANYLKYFTLNEALQSDLKCPIPSSFYVLDENYEEQEVSMGIWTGPKPKFGESVTQECQGYEFVTHFGKVTLIDTPGTDDTKGLDQDKINCNKIVEYLRKYKHLSAICIMLQANCSREDAAFEFCLKQLFSRLPKSFASNICFVFTHAQTSVVPWEVGNIGPSITNFTKRIAESGTGVQIPFSTNCFCVDNEGLRLVATYQSGLRNFNQKKSAYAESWSRSREECIRLLEYVCKLTPQPTRDIVFLNKASKVVNVLKGTSSELDQQVQGLSEVKSDCANAIMGLSTYQKHLERKRYYISTELIRRPLQLGRFVCKVPDCPKTVKLGHVPNLASESCHFNCSLKIPECYTNSKRGKCSDCGCYFRCHEHVNFEYIYPGQRIEDLGVAQKFMANNDIIQSLSNDLEIYKKKCDEIHETVAMLYNVEGAFIKYLKDNAILLNEEILSLNTRKVEIPDLVTAKKLEQLLQEVCSNTLCGSKLKSTFSDLLNTKSDSQKQFQNNFPVSTKAKKRYGWY